MLRFSFLKFCANLTINQIYFIFLFVEMLVTTEFNKILSLQAKYTDCTNLLSYEFFPKLSSKCVISESIVFI